MTTNNYSGPTKLLHWLTVTLLVIQYAVGWLMPDVHRNMPTVGLVGWHLSIGTAIILLVVIRLVWHWIKPSPPPLQTVSPLLQKLGRATHSLLYILLVAFPLMGWVNASAHNLPLTLFGLIPLPSLAPDSKTSLLHAFGELHSPFTWVLLAVVVLHVMGALYHHLIVKDETLRRMLP
jgi:cytochrome b561